MDDHSHATDNAIDQTDQELLIFSVSDEALEKAAGGTTWGRPILVRASRRCVSGTPHSLRCSAAKLLTRDEARRIAAIAAKQPELLCKL
jgi:hypothetical protein